jgi:hypothetical protein
MKASRNRPNAKHELKSKKENSSRIICTAKPYKKLLSTTALKRGEALLDF